MKTIELKSISIENFRGIRSLNIEFGKTLTEIVGDNSTGKSTIFAAFCWGLFGKDEHDRKDYEIKPTVKGASQRTDTAVSIALMVEGEAHLLKRTYREKWQKPKGCVDEVFKGNETVCEWDGAPVAVNEYAKRVADIVDETLFKMLTNPYYFANLHWKEQRTALFNMIPAISDDEIASKNEEFRALLDKLGGKSMQDFKNEIVRSLKQLRDEHATIEPKINEVQHEMPEGEIRDNAVIDEEIKSVESQVDELENQLVSEEKAERAHNDLLRDLRMELEKLNKNEAMRRRELDTEEMNRVDAANKERRMLSSDIDIAEQDIRRKSEEMESIRRRIDSENKNIEDMTKQRETLRNEYEEESSKEFETEGKCPTCGQTLPKEMQDEAEKRFNAQKQYILDGIVSRGQRLNAVIESASNRKESLRNKYSELKEANDASEKSLADMRARYDAMPIEGAKNIDYESDSVIEGIRATVAGFQSKMDEILRSETDEVSENQKRELKESIDTLRARHAELIREQSRSEFIQKSVKRIEELKNRGRELAQMIADYERRVFVITNFDHAKVEELEKHVNAMFHNVTWKLFDYTVEGNPVETCVAIVGDAVFPVANTAGQINAGLDIIHTMSEVYGLRCPIFIDNAEGITNIESRDLQLVSLYVVAGESLRVRKSE